ncbi:hypothetical protein [Uliginosibacterium gangwonense]|uniref:hypothetical protein n=1 Tax=Uliginosibacterium gangwonense TaxID=392736 RepID=UPI00037BE646|nr:hypothetical protein [Uliginosibacterium gangwonense]
MAQFEDQQGDALQIAHEIGRMLIALRIDWNDAKEMRAIAREALAYHTHGKPSAPLPRTKLELFGLIGLMLKTMEEGAEFHRLIHGNDVWKAMARALWEEKTGRTDNIK